MRRIVFEVLAITAAAAIAGGTVALGQPTAAPTAPAPAPTPAPEWTSYPPCAAEDGPAPCVWDAQTSGNGTGTSFFIGTDQCTYRFGPAGPYRDTEFPCRAA